MFPVMGSIASPRTFLPVLLGRSSGNPAAALVPALRLQTWLNIGTCACVKVMADAATAMHNILSRELVLAARVLSDGFCFML